MKKTLKKITAVILTLLMVFSVSSVAFAAEEKIAPVVFIPGFCQRETKVYDDNGEYLGNLATFELAALNNVTDIVAELITPLLSSVITRTDAELSSTVHDYMYEIFKPFALNDDGSYVYNRVVRSFNLPYSQLPREDQLHVYGHISLNSLPKAYDDVRYFFTYDSFGSIIDAANKFHDYLHNIVMAQTGADKLDIVPISQGGTVFAMWLDLYPEDAKYIRKVVNFVPAFDGSEIVGDIATDSVNIYDIEKVHEEILPALLPDSDLAYQISLALRVALDTETTEKLLRSAVDAARDILLRKSSMMWGLCPAEDYAAAKDILLGDERYSAVRAETDRYDEARKNLKNNIQSLMDKGISVHNLVCYDGKYIVGDLFESKDNNCDALLAVSSPSLGATAAKLGETLPADYVSEATYCSNPAHNHISPDRVIDASTGYLPENTWYFKGVAHDRLNSREDVKNFAAQLIMNDSIKDIYTYPGCSSQFINPKDNIASSKEADGFISYYDADGNFMYREAAPEEKTEGFSFWKILATVMNFLFKFLKHLGFNI